MIKFIQINYAPCVWCGALQEQHVNGIQCLFGPTRHSPISAYELSEHPILRDGERAGATEFYGGFTSRGDDTTCHLFNYVMHYHDGRGGDTSTLISSDWVMRARK